MAYEPPEKALHESAANLSSLPVLAAPAWRGDTPSNTSLPGANRVTTEAAASCLGRSVRTLEDWRQSWRQNGTADGSGQCKGPKFVKVGKHVLYEVCELEKFHAARKAHGTGGA